MQGYKKLLSLAVILILIVSILNSEIFGSKEKDCILQKEIEKCFADEPSLDSDKALLIIFFSLDCSVCYREILKFNELYDRLKFKMKIIGLSREGQDSISEFQRIHGIKFPLYSDQFGRVHKKLKVKVLPYKIIIKCNRVIYQDNIYKNPLELQNDFNKVLDEISK